MTHTDPTPPAGARKPQPTTRLNGTTYSIDEDKTELRNVADPSDTIRFDSVSDLQTYQFWTEQLQFIVGHRVTRAEMLYDEIVDGWKPVILFEDCTALEILQDEEGNGPGRFGYLE
jgi:hypothetical protein